MWDWTGASDTPWYNIRASITSVVIGNGVQNIGNYAFYDVSQMSGATISLTVSRIGNQAFRNCDGMTKIEIPYSVEAIGEYAFYDCDGLITVQIPGSVLSVGNYAFAGCGKLTEASLSSGMSGIPPYMFQNCSSLLDLNFPVSITGVGAYAFNGCTKLRDVYYGGSEDQWSQVTVGVNNVPLLNANIIFESLPTTVSVTGVGLDQETMVLKAGETGLLTVTVVPANATNSNVSWSTSNPNVATVSNGMVTAVGAGTAAITVTTEDGSKTASCTVTVPKPDDPTPVGDVPLKLVTSYSKGAKTATINIVTTSPITLANYDMQLGWDQSVFTLSGTANGQSGKLSTFVSNLNSTKDDYGKISAMTDGNNATIAADEILASYTLTTVNALNSGEYAFSLKIEEVADQNAEPLSWSGGSVSGMLSISRLSLDANFDNRTKNKATVNCDAPAAGDFTVTCEKPCVVVYSDGSAWRSISAVAFSGQSNLYSFNLPGDYDDTQKIVVCIKGDFTADGAVNSTDALQVLRASVGSRSYDAVDVVISDFNGDNKLTSTDALQILRLSVGIRTVAW